MLVPSSLTVRACSELPTLCPRLRPGLSVPAAEQMATRAARAIGEQSLVRPHCLGGPRTHPNGTHRCLERRWRFQNDSLQAMQT